MGHPRSMSMTSTSLGPTVAPTPTLHILQTLTLVFFALALVPAGAHFFELPNKIGLPPADYMTVQGIYRGWALFGIVIFGALGLSAFHAIAVRKNRAALLWSIAAFLLVAATQVIFWTYTYPMNALTESWTVTPPDLDAVRRQWEYSHAVTAVITLGALVAMTLSVLASRPLSRAEL